jgi:ribosomal protein S27E
MKNLKSLEQHNALKAAMYFQQTDTVPNGIECPGCAKELVDTDPGKALLSSPPKTPIGCPVCGFRGYRVL